MVQKIKLKCLKCKNVKSEEILTPIEIACNYCSGEIELIVDDSGKIIKKSLKLYKSVPIPTKGITIFTCPITLPDPRKSNLVQQFEVKKL